MLATSQNTFTCDVIEGPPEYASYIAVNIVRYIEAIYEENNGVITLMQLGSFMISVGTVKLPKLAYGTY